MKIVYVLVAILSIAFARTASAQPNCEHIRGIDDAMTRSLTQKLETLGDLRAIEKSDALVIIRVIQSASGSKGAYTYAQSVLAACPEFQGPHGVLASNAIFLVVPQDDKPSIFRGSKLEPQLTQETIDEIKESDMEPFVAQGDAIGAVIGGLQSISQHMQNPIPTGADGVQKPVEARTTAASLPAATAETEREITALREQNDLLFNIIILLVIFLPLSVACHLLHRKHVNDLRTELDKQIEIITGTVNTVNKAIDRMNGDWKLLVDRALKTAPDISHQGYPDDPTDAQINDSDETLESADRERRTTIPCQKVDSAGAPVPAVPMQ
jgi:uncharacterized membrane protein YgcG